ncbi:uncharacterized protein LOC143029267 isoform X2 [Oratosquilla oratoria]|uniref:uncharacterized protein LOC143029267 isoform X2 n=1 Tax=Oratosquilla oratoria TaxID=337810 RepID=UPI003F76A9AE
MLNFQKPITSRPSLSLNDNMWNEIFDAVIKGENCHGTGSLDLTKDIVERSSTDKKESLIQSCKQISDRKKPKDSQGQKPRKRISLKGNADNVTVNNGTKTSDIRTRLFELQAETDAPVWVQCISCDKWRILRDTLDPSDIPEIWDCSMNTDPIEKSCDVCEEDWYKENQDYFIYNKFTLGSVVWATLAKHYWWPAMVDDDPDTETFFWLNDFSDIPNYYHVTFFGKPVERAWVFSQDVVKFRATDKVEDFLRKKKLPKCTGRILDQLYFAHSQARSALRMNLKDRRYKFCFAARYKGPWESSGSSEVGSFKKIFTERTNESEAHSHSSSASSSSDSSDSDDSSCDEMNESNCDEKRCLSTTVKKKRGGSNSNSESINDSPKKRKIDTADDSSTSSKKKCSEDEEDSESHSQNCLLPKISSKVNVQDGNRYTRDVSVTEKEKEVDCDVVRPIGHLKECDESYGGNSSTALEKGKDNLCTPIQDQCSNKENVPP